MKYVTSILAAASLFFSCGNNSTATSSGNETMKETASTATVQAPPAAPKTAELSCKLNGKDWKGVAGAGGQLYYAKGITGMYGGLPYCSLAFSAADAPDNRQLTIAFKNFPGKTGVYNKEKVEVLLSGSATGDAKKSELQGHKIPAQATDFSIAISDWKVTTANEIVASGTLSGTLKGVFDAPDVKIENGVFSNVKIILYSEKY
jgi:hypothetical protein